MSQHTSTQARCVCGELRAGAQGHFYVDDMSGSSPPPSPSSITVNLNGACAVLRSVALYLLTLALLPREPAAVLARFWGAEQTPRRIGWTNASQ